MITIQVEMINGWTGTYTVKDILQLDRDTYKRVTILANNETSMTVNAILNNLPIDIRERTTVILEESYNYYEELLFVDHVRYVDCTLRVYGRWGVNAKLITFAGETALCRYEVHETTEPFIGTLEIDWNVEAAYHDTPHSAIAIEEGTIYFNNIPSRNNIMFVASGYTMNPFRVYTTAQRDALYLLSCNKTFSDMFIIGEHIVRLYRCTLSGEETYQICLDSLMWGSRDFAAMLKNIPGFVLRSSLFVNNEKTAWISYLNQYGRAIWDIAHAWFDARHRMM